MPPALARDYVSVRVIFKLVPVVVSYRDVKARLMIRLVGPSTPTSAELILTRGNKKV